MLYDVDQPLDKLKYEVAVEVPNSIIFKTNGAYHVLDEQEENIVASFNFDFNNTILSTSTLVEGEVFGLVLYSGRDTKLRYGRTMPLMKRSKADDEINSLIKVLFASMLFISLLLVTLKGVQPDPITNIIQFVRYMLLLLSIIPISMKLNQDISKFFYTRRIRLDNDIPGTEVMNSMVSEDLGRIDYIVTDKTGTLTKNELTLRFIASTKDVIDARDTEDNRTSIKRALNELKNPFHKNANFNNWITSVYACLLSCNTVSIDESGRMEGNSQDELALLEHLKELGYCIIIKNQSHIEYIDPTGVQHYVEVLETFFFDYTRKRMFVFVNTGRGWRLFAKGSDTTVIPLLKTEKEKEDASRLADSYAARGFRVMIVAEKSYSDSDANEMLKRIEVAKRNSLVGSNSHLDDICNELEEDLTFLCVQF